MNRNLFILIAALFVGYYFYSKKPDDTSGRKELVMLLCNSELVLKNSEAVTPVIDGAGSQGAGNLTVNDLMDKAQNLQSGLVNVASVINGYIASNPESRKAFRSLASTKSANDPSYSKQIAAEALAKCPGKSLDVEKTEKAALMALGYFRKVQGL